MTFNTRFDKLKTMVHGRLILLFVFLMMGFDSYSKERIFIQDTNLSTNEKEAILILPGFGSKIQGTKDIATYFFNKKYDVFIPQYLSRKSIKKCVTNLNEFVTKKKLKDYKKLHVFSYIVGSWTLNQWMLQNPEIKISSIVYDRSPLQERAPYALIQDIPFLIRLVAGPIMREFSNTPYPPIVKGATQIGILIENKATKLVNKHKKTVMKLGEVQWSVDSLHQSYDDYHHIWVNHDEMYFNMSDFADEILYFFANGHFSEKANHEKFTTDPFIVFKK